MEGILNSKSVSQWETDMIGNHLLARAFLLLAKGHPLGFEIFKSECRRSFSDEECKEIFSILDCDDVAKYIREK